MKVEAQLKENEKYKIDLKNQRKTYFTAQQQNTTQFAANMGQSLMSMINKPTTTRQSGYQPGMY